MPKEELLTLIEDLMEILEIHVRNSVNLCLSGGMETLMEMIFSNPHEEVRREALGVFTFVNLNNIEVQKITFKLGALNLMHQYVRESNTKNREAVISGLSAFLRGINTDGKRAFLSEFNGLAFIKKALLDA
jgi:hypothetical protein